MTTRMLWCLFPVVYLVGVRVGWSAGRESNLAEYRYLLV